MQADVTHHLLALKSAGVLDSCLSGQVYSLGRAEYGRLGLGEGAEEKSEPTPVTGIELAKGVSCGASVSYAVTREGENQGNRDGKSKVIIFF